MGSKNNHLDTLRLKHRSLDREIEELERQPGRNSLFIASKKREKLRIKEEITRVEAALDAELIEEIKSASILRLAAE